MRAITVARIGIFISAVGLFAIFFRQNTGAVDIEFPFVRPHRCGLIYLMLISFILGAFTSLVIAMLVNVKVREKRKLRESKDLVDDG